MITRQPLLALLALLSAGPALADCLPWDCKFSISGKRGAFLTAQVKPDVLAKADTVVVTNLGGSRGLANQSLNRGELAGTGLAMPATEAALMQLLDKIRAVWPLRAPPPVRIRLIGSTVFNASAKPDNVIVVPIGVIDRAQSDDEVMWLLAHEFSHIALAHFAREAESRQGKSGISSSVDALMTAAELSQTRVDSSSGKVRVYAVQDKHAQAISASVWAHSRDVGTILELFNQRLSRKQEDEADAAGLDLLIAAGYSDEGAGDALNTIARDEARIAAAAGTFSAQLGRYMQQATATAAMQALGQGQTTGTNLSAIGNNLLGNIERNVGRMFADKVLDMAKTSHRPAVRRKRGLGDYLDAPGVAPPGYNPPPTRRDWINAVRATAEFKEAVIAVNAHDAALDKLAAMTSLAQPNIPGAAPDPAALRAPAEALALLQPAFATRYRATPLIANAAAKIYDANGQSDEADRRYDAAERGALAPPPAPAAAAAKGKRGKKPAAAPAPVAAPLPSDSLYQQSLDGFSDHVRLLVRMRNYRKALTVIDTAKVRFGDDDAFLPELVSIYVQTGQNAVALTTISRCMETEDDALRKRCNYAMLTEDVQKKLDTLSPDDRAKVELALAKTGDTSRRTNWLQSISKGLAPSEQ